MLRWCAIAAAIGAGVLAHGEAEVDVLVERTEVRLNESFTIEVRARGLEMSEISFPEIDGLRVRLFHQAQSYQFDGRRQVAEIILTYAATAYREGEVVIQGVSVRAGNEVYTAKPVTLKVVKTSDATQQENEMVIVESSVSKNVVYVNEPILLKWSLLRLRRYRDMIDSHRSARVKHPTTEGFYALEPVQEHTERIQGNAVYDVVETTQLLYATSPGELTIGPYFWEGTIWVPRDGGRFGRGEWRQEQRSTEPIKIHVRELPAAPPGFSGAVGDFEVVATMDRQEVPQGVPVRLDVRIQGYGNPDAIGSPQLPNVPGVYVSDPEIESNLSSDGNAATAEKVFRYTMTPSISGIVEIPPLQFIYFNPDSEQYVTRTAGPFTLDVLAVANTANRVVGGADAENPAEVVAAAELQPPILSVSGLRPARASGFALVLGTVTPPLAYAAFALFLARKRRLETDVAYARALFARSKRLKMLDAVHDARDPAQELYRAVAGFVGDKFNAHDPGMTPEDARDLCRRQGLPDDIVGGVERVLRSCQRARYAGGKLSRQEIDALIQASAMIFDKVDECLKNRGEK